jgi:hypothetical protein
MRWATTVIPSKPDTTKRELINAILRRHLMFFFINVLLINIVHTLLILTDESKETEIYFCVPPPDPHNSSSILHVFYLSEIICANILSGTRHILTLPWIEAIRYIGKHSVANGILYGKWHFFMFSRESQCWVAGRWWDEQQQSFLRNLTPQNGN